MGWIRKIILWVWKTFAPKNPSEFKEMQEYYQSQIKFLRDEHDKDISAIKEKYELQISIIESYRHKHPGNGEELDHWKKREQELMLQIVKEKEEKLFWKERAIFIEKENELLLLKQEKKT